ncbi:DUF6634 family protein [Nitratireductor sp. CH_MIT9313-5]|uniref:DUF6634 family protein n=1 Tax=Nitratireductor sp. CH_MIT9313-5 TaxID=3107764 RepID=UPI003FA600AA
MFRIGSPLRPQVAQELWEEIQRLEELVAQLRILLSPPVLLDRHFESVHKNAIPIEQWHFSERWVPCLTGSVTDHPSLGEGPHRVRTSQLWAVSEELKLARTYSRWYRLGSKARNSSHDLADTGFDPWGDRGFDLRENSDSD